MWNTQKLNEFDGALYKKVIQLIESYIEQGMLVSNERLPAERELAHHLQVNRSTVVHALDVLTERGVLVRRRGSGTFVNNQKWGLQTYPTINWRLPASFHKRDLSLYQQKVEHINKQNYPLCDLSNGDLPASLIPQLTLPKMSSSELITHEKNTDILQLGLPSLKQQIAEYMQCVLGVNVNIDEILITSGTQQSLFLITQGLLKPGDAIGIELPSYFYSLPLFQAAGLRFYGIKTDAEGILLESLEEAVDTHQIKWLFLNPIFQNPTGYLMSAARKKAVLAFCRARSLGIVEDDAYSGLAFSDGYDISPIKKYDHNHQVIYLGSLSKYIGRSIRIGWMVAPCEIIRKLAEIRQCIDSGLSILPQLLAEDYLKNHYFTHQKRVRVELDARAKQLIDWLNVAFGDRLRYKAPLGGFHLYVNLGIQNAHHEMAFLNQLLAKNVIVASGQNFGDKPGQVRLSFGHFNQTLVTNRLFY